MTTDRWRWLIWSASVVLICVLAIFWGQLDRIQAGGYFRIAYHATIWVAMCGTVFAFPQLNRKQSFLLIGVAAIFVRLAFWQAPVSDDVNRYLWEGSLIWKGENPYATVVDDERWIEHRDEYWEDVNHRDRLTAYPPGVELVMAGASWLWYDLQVFKIVALVGDFWILGILMLLFGELRKAPRWLCFYAFNPIVLASFAVEAHFDSLMVGAMLTALLMAQRKRFGWVWFWLGVAVQMKLIVVVLLPYYFVRADWRKSAPFFLVLIIPSLFFGEHLLQGVVGLLGFGKDGAFNGGFYEALRLLGLSDVVARSSTMMTFVLVGLFFGWRTLRGQEKDLKTLTFVIMASLLVCSPVVHFWYLTWIIPLVALRPSLSWLVLCFTTALYFMAWEGLLSGDGWGYHRVWVVLTWIPFFLVALWEYRFTKSRLKTKEFEPAASMDLIVPVYNAAEGLSEFLERLQKASPEAGEIIVVDAGSTDESAVIAQAKNCRVISAGLGRGEQIAAGLRESRADLMAIIHADTLPVKGWIPRIIEGAQMNPRSSAFALGQRFSSNQLGLLFVEFLNEARGLLGGSIFGDQTLIVRREALIRIGGFPEQPLMEDVEVSLRLLKEGRISYLGQEWLVSATKWRGRFVQRFTQVVGLMIRYRWIRRKGTAAAEEFSKQLYREYYRR